jgi:hypothetical protein
MNANKNKPHASTYETVAEGGACVVVMKFTSHYSKHFHFKVLGVNIETFYGTVTVYKI